MKLTMLGTGDALVTECYNTCFIIDDKGQLFMVDGGGGNTWELCKPGSNKNQNHIGSGSMVFEAAMNWAAKHGAERRKNGRCQSHGL